MSCFICGRGNCTPSFHSLEEQSFFDDAEAAYDNYIEVRDKCREEWASQGEEEEEDDDSHLEQHAN